jgi:AcrR family transcriptional regulator
MSLSVDVVVDAGVALVQREGLAAVSLRAVAASLGVTPMALYRHVADSESLIAAVIERIVSDLPSVVLPVASLNALRPWATEMRTALSRYPGVANHLLTHWFELPAMLAVIEDLLCAARDVGLGGFEAVAAANALFMFVLMRVEAEHAVQDAKAARRSLRLPRTGFPLLRANRHLYEVAQFDAHFAYGLDLIIDGITTRGAS